MKVLNISHLNNTILHKILHIKIMNHILKSIALLSAISANAANTTAPTPVTPALSPSVSSIRETVQSVINVDHRLKDIEATFMFCNILASKRLGKEQKIRYQPSVAWMFNTFSINGEKRIALGVIGSGELGTKELKDTIISARLFARALITDIISSEIGVGFSALSDEGNRLLASVAAMASLTKGLFAKVELVARSKNLNIDQNKLDSDSKIAKDKHAGDVVIFEKYMADMKDATTADEKRKISFVANPGSFFDEPAEEWTWGFNFGFGINSILITG
jgi:hypothetical protein